MDTHRFDRLVRHIPGSSRRVVLAALPTLAVEVWRGSDGMLDVDARCRPKSDKKAINKKGYIFCIDGENKTVGAVQHCRLVKQGVKPGWCPGTGPSSA